MVPFAAFAGRRMHATAASRAETAPIANTTDGQPVPSGLHDCWRTERAGSGSVRWTLKGGPLCVTAASHVGVIDVSSSSGRDVNGGLSAHRPKKTINGGNALSNSNLKRAEYAETSSGLLARDHLPTVSAGMH